MSGDSNLEYLDPGTTALITIDVQNDFCHPEGTFAKMGLDVSLMEAVIPNIRELQAAVRHKGLLSIFVQTQHTQFTNSATWLARMQGKGKNDICIAGSWGAELCGLDVQQADIIVKKHRYSSFLGTDLDLILRSRGIAALVLCGVVSNVCVETAARDGFQLGYDVIVVNECVAAPTMKEHESAIWNIEHYFGKVMALQDVINRLKS